MASSTLHQSKLKILYAAAAVTEKVGASNLTLERIAEEAGISKGGLLYHYANKRALLEGMVEYMIAPLQSIIEASHKSDAKPIDFLTLNNRQNPKDRALGQVLLAAAAEDPELLNPARALFAQWLTLATSQSQSALVLLLASEGLRFLDLLDMLPPDIDQGALLASLNQFASETNGS